MSVAALAYFLLLRKLRQETTVCFVKEHVSLNCQFDMRLVERGHLWLHGAGVIRQTCNVVFCDRLLVTSQVAQLIKCYSCRCCIT